MNVDISKRQKLMFLLSIFTDVYSRMMVKAEYERGDPLFDLRFVILMKTKEMIY